MYATSRSVFLSALLLPALSLFAAKISGTVTDRGSGKAIEGARVVVAGLGGRGSADTATTDAKGAYAFGDVATGFHTLIAAMSGYQPATGTVNASQANGSYTVNLSLVPSAGGGGTGAVIGTVMDDSTKEAIKNATIILSGQSGRGGLAPVDTVLTDGEGRFAFDSVPAGNNYVVAASAAGYGSATNSNVDVASRDTVKITLGLGKIPPPNASIIGTVTDAGNREALEGATVILRRRAANGADWMNLDTAKSGGDGGFKFTGLEGSTQLSPYSLLVSKSDYSTRSSGSLVVANNRTDTVNVALAKVAKGSMNIFVGLDSTGNPALEGATVAAILNSAGDPALEGVGGDVYTGTTDAKGWVVFAGVVAGSYSVTANLDGFVSKVAARTVAPDEKDTGYVYLARATARNSRTLSGLVRDADGKAMEGAKVLFEANGNSGILLAATVAASGDYVFGGIPTNVNGGTVTVSLDGFAGFSASVNLNGAETFLNVTLEKASGILVRGSESPFFRAQRDGSGWMLRFQASDFSGTLSLYDLRGARLGSIRIPAGTTSARLFGAIRSEGSGFAVLTQGASIRRLRLPTP